MNRPDGDAYAGGDIVDLVVVGSGAAGLTLAAAWARLGRTGVIVDKQHQQYGLPRAGHIDHEIMRLLQVLDADGPTREDAYETEYYKWINAQGETLLEFPWGEEGISGWHSDYMQNSAILEESLLRKIIASQTVTHRPGWQLVELVQHADCVEAQIERTTMVAGEPVPVLTGEREILRARYLVGCDGSNSRVREGLGITREDLGFNERWLVIDARMKRPVTIGFDSGQICDPRRPITVLPLGKHHRRWEWHIRPDEETATFLTPEKGWELLGDLGITSADVKPVRQLVYTFEARIARQWQSGRVLLAGDAAHTMPPFMGQGMCSGMRDAWNLAWKLDLVLNGHTPPELLDTYQVERDPHVRDWTVISIESGKIPCITDPDEAERRDQLFREGFRPPMPDFPQLHDGVLHRDARGGIISPAGELGLQGRVRIGERVDLFDRLLPTRGFVITSIAGDPTSALRPDQRVALARIGAQALHLTQGADDGEAIVDVDGTYSSYMRRRGIEVVINRPDFYVFAGCKMEALEGVVDDLLAQLEVASAAAAAGLTSDVRTG